MWNYVFINGLPFCFVKFCYTPYGSILYIKNEYILVYFKVDSEAYLFGCYDFQWLRPKVIYFDEWLRRENYNHHAVSCSISISHCIHLIKGISLCVCFYACDDVHSVYVYVIRTHTHIYTQTYTHRHRRAHTQTRAHTHTGGTSVMMHRSAEAIHTSTKINK